MRRNLVRSLARRRRQRGARGLAGVDARAGAPTAAEPGNERLIGELAAHEPSPLPDMLLNSTEWDGLVSSSLPGAFASRLQA